MPLIRLTGMLFNGIDRCLEQLEEMPRADESAAVSNGAHVTAVDDNVDSMMYAA